MGNKYNKTAKSTYYKSSKKEHMKTEYNDYSSTLNIHQDKSVCLSHFQKK